MLGDTKDTGIRHSGRWIESSYQQQTISELMDERDALAGKLEKLKEQSVSACQDAERYRQAWMSAKGRLDVYDSRIDGTHSQLVSDFADVKSELTIVQECVKELRADKVKLAQALELHCLVCMKMSGYKSDQCEKCTTTTTLNAVGMERQSHTRKILDSETGSG